MASTDRAGHRLTGSAAAVAAYNEGVDRVLQLRTGAVESFSRALALDPTFALAHAALALLAHEFCVPVDAAARLRCAVQHAQRSTARERDHVAAVAGHVSGDRRALVRHLEAHPDDALALSVAVPTIAFAGVASVPEDAWRVVESCAPAYGDDWFAGGLLAFVRQEQGRFDEALDLAVRSLQGRPGSGHAAHARAHVHYETGDHAGGLGWLDGWITGDGAGTDNLAHFAWHAALHELSTGDLDAVRRRYEAQLSPAQLAGCRALVDTGSLVWRWGLTPGVRDVPAVREAVAGFDELVHQPPTPFMGLHAAVALAAADDAGGLRTLEHWAASHPEPAYSCVVAPVARALRLLVEDHPSAAADALGVVWPQVWRVGGSDAQREVVEETRIVALLRAGRHAEACRIVDRRLDRRRCRRDEWFREAATGAAVRRA
jgi:tetratricopeptide (TPR) repeat protein